MGTVLSALAVLCALTASGVLLAQLAISESRRGRERAAPGRAPSEPRTLPMRTAPEPMGPPERVRAPEPERWSLPERTVPPLPVPVTRPAPVQPVAWAPTLSPDGAWLWTGSAWVPAWWGGPTVPPPPPFAAAAHPRPARSHGCATAFGVGCGMVLGIIALIVLAVVAAAGGLSLLTGG
jgi:hypothetical protein